MKIQYLREPDDLQCGQAVLSMLTGMSVTEVVSLLDNSRETTLREMKSLLRQNGFYVSNERVMVEKKEELPPLCFLSLETPRCWHWSLFCEGVFYDPEHGVMDDFPVSRRRYYWEVRRDDF